MRRRPLVGRRRIKWWFNRGERHLSSLKIGCVTLLIWGVVGCAKKPVEEHPTASSTPRKAVELSVEEIIVSDPFSDAKPRSRPQTPEGPFPYTIREITYQNPQDGVNLAATVTLPAGDGPFPAVVLISGSGAQDRDSTIMGHRPFAVWADYLSRNGVAVLRQDDRGVGQSTGSTPDATMEQKAQDAVVARKALAALERVDSRRTGLMGHSEGAMVATRASALSPTPFVIWLAGPTMDLGEILVIQKGLILEANNASADHVEQAKRVNAKAVTNIREGGPREELDAIIAAMVDMDLKYAGMGQNPEALEGVRNQMIRRVTQMLTSPAIRSGIQYDPMVDLMSFEGDFLGVWGGADLQVPPTENLAVMKGSATKPAIQNMELRVYAKLNHLLQFSDTGRIAEYPVHPESVHPRVLKDFLAWIVNEPN